MMGVNIHQNSDGSVSFIDDLLGEVLRVGGDASVGWKNDQCARIPLSATAGNGGVFAWTHPTGLNIIITNVVLNITAAGSGTITVGTAANASTSSANLIDTLSLSSTGTFDNIADKGTNGKSRQYLQSAAGQYITRTASGTPNGLVGYAYVFWCEA